MKTAMYLIVVDHPISTADSSIFELFSFQEVKLAIK